MDNKQVGAEQRKPNMMLEAKRFVVACLKGWRIFVVSVLVTVALAVAFLATRKPTVEVTASLMLPPESSSGGLLSLTDLAGSFNMGDMFGGSSTENEVAMIQSHSVFEKTSRDLLLNISYTQKEGFMNWVQVYDSAVRIRLDVNPAIADTLGRPILFKLTENGNGKFSITAKQNKKKILDAKNVELPTTIKLPDGEFTFTKTKAFDNPEKHIGKFLIGFDSYNGSSQKYAKKVLVFAPSKKTDFISLSYTCLDPNFGKKLLGTIIDNYNLVCNNRKNDNNEINLNFVQRRLTEIEGELAQAENAMQKFKEANKLTEPEADAQILLEKNSALEAALMEARTNNEILKMTRDFLNDSKNDGELIPIIGGSASESDPTTGESLISQYNKLVLEMKGRDMQLNSTEGDYTQEFNAVQLVALKKNILSTIGRTIAASDRQVADLLAKTNETVNRMGTIPAIERDYISLERELILKQQLYLFLLKQREENDMMLSKVMPSLLTIDAPYVLADDSAMGTKLVLLIAIFFGGLIGMGVVFVKRLKSQPYLEAEGIADSCDAPTLASLPSTASDLPVLMPGNEGQAFRDLRARLLPLLSGCDGNTVLVASAINAEGKTYTATNLAAVMALAGYKTVLVCGDLRSGMCPLTANTDGGATLFGLIAGADKPIATCKEIESLHIVLAGKSGGVNAADALSSASLLTVMERLKKEYQIVVIDTPAIGDCPDAFAFAPCADITLFLARVGITCPIQTELANSIVAAGRLPRVAMVANA